MPARYSGDDEVARGALRRIDWVLRGRAQRQLEHALIDASLVTGAVSDEPETIRHRLRAAG